MPLNSVPATTTVAALELKRSVAEGQAFVDVGFWGGAVPDNLADLAPLHEAGVFGFKCFLLDSGVAEFPHLPPDAFAAAMAETARIGALMIVHAEDGSLLDESALDGEHYAGFLASRPRAAEEAAIALVLEHGAGDRRAYACRAPVGRGRRPDAAVGSRRGRGRVGRDLPALPDLRRRARARRRHRAEVLPAHPRGRQPRGAVGRAGRGRRRPGGLRPLAVHGVVEGQPRLRAGVGRDLLGPARPAGRVVRGPGARALARRRGAVDGDGPGRPGRADRPRTDRRRRPGRPGAVRPGRGVHRRRGPAQAPQRRVGVRRPAARGRGTGDLAARRTGGRRCCPEDNCW